MTNARTARSRLLAERPIASDATGSARGRPARSVSVNLTESPLAGCSPADTSAGGNNAGERLRADWERGQLAPRITMAWDAAPVQRSRGGSAQCVDLNGAQLDARRRFEAAVAEAGPELADIL